MYWKKGVEFLGRLLHGGWFLASPFYSFRGWPPHFSGVATLPHHTHTHTHAHTYPHSSTHRGWGSKITVTAENITGKSHDTHAYT